MNLFNFNLADASLGLWHAFMYGLFFGFFFGLARALMVGVFERKEG